MVQICLGLSDTTILILPTTLIWAKLWTYYLSYRYLCSKCSMATSGCPPSQLRAVWVCSSQYARWVTHGLHDHPAHGSTNLDEQSLDWILFFHWVHVHLLTTMISTVTFFWSLVLFTFFFKEKNVCP